MQFNFKKSFITNNTYIMKKYLIIPLVLVAALVVGFASFTAETAETPETIYPFEAVTIDGQKQSLADYKGKVVLIVNVASKCGYTNQYEGLQKLYSTYKDRGVVVLGFPCNQFGSQEPGTAEDIKSFCSLTYQVDFPMFDKVDVNGDTAHPLYVFLKSQKAGSLGTEAIKWNFTKFLVGRDGKVVERFAPSTTPAELTASIEALL